MYGTYWGFSLPLSKSAALVARRPSVLPLASTTYHLRSISLPLGTKVPISLLPSKHPARQRIAGHPGLPYRQSQPKTTTQSAFARANKRTGLNSTHCQTNLFGGGLRGLALVGLWLGWANSTSSSR